MKNLIWIFDNDKFLYISVKLNCRGDLKSKEINENINWLKKNKKVNFVEWCPSGFKVSCTKIVAKQVKGDDLADFEQSATMIANNSCMSRFLKERVCHEYTLTHF